MNDGEKLQGAGARPGAAFADRVARNAVRLAGSADVRVLVACSGGADSSTLAHVLRFSDAAPRPVLAHFDHRMRAGSRADAAWVAGLARAWELELIADSADRVPESEAEARDARYAFLESARRRAGADFVLTAHHADDQAETVLFRASRGTGPDGLAGIPEQRGTILRPLLPFRRSEIEAYARETGLRWRRDPSNADERYARNVIRHSVMPALERVSPAPVRALVRLGELAERDEAAWSSLLPGLAARVTVDDAPGRVVLARQAFLELHEGVRARVLRYLAGRLDASPGDAGTEAALAFTTSASSGRKLSMTGGLELRREFDRLVLERPDDGPETVLAITGPGPGGGRFAISGRCYRARWGRADAPHAGWVWAREADEVTYPLELRGRRKGDRMTFPYGTKKLKKVLAEARVPLGERDRLPVLADGRGRVVWVPGVAGASRPAGRETFYVAVEAETE